MTTTNQYSLTISDVARQSELPRSTVRFYLQNFYSYFPVIETNKGKRFSQEAVEVVTTIRQLYQQNYDKEYIASALHTWGVAFEPLHQHPMHNELKERVIAVENRLNELDKRVKEHGRQRFKLWR